MGYDVVIIGGGPAGLAAGTYASRARLSTLILEKQHAGGQVAITDQIENYPGLTEPISGSELSEKMKIQAEKFGAKFENGEVVKVEKHESGFTLTLKNDKKVDAHCVIVASGAAPRKLGCKGEEEFSGAGVSYCATCDGAFFTDLPVMVVGGGDTAIEDALYLSRLASKVYVVHRRDELRATKIIQERAFANKKIEILWNSVVEEIKGDDIVNEVVIKNTKTGELSTVKVNGVFMAVGYVPNTDFIKDMIELNDRGYIITNEIMETSQEGIYAAGDVREKTLRQVVTAVADGAIAADQAGKYIEGEYPPYEAISKE